MYRLMAELQADHEPQTSRTTPPTRCCRRPVGSASAGKMPAAPWFTGSPLSFCRTHWDHEPLRLAETAVKERRRLAGKMHADNTPAGMPARPAPWKGPMTLMPYV